MQVSSSEAQNVRWCWFYITTYGGEENKYVNLLELVGFLHLFLKQFLILFIQLIHES